VFLIKNIYLYGVGNASFCLNILSDESNIPFYFTSNGYKYMTRISLKGAEPVPNVTVGLSSVATSASEVKKTRKNAIVEYLEIRYPLLSLRDQINRDMQAANRDLRNRDMQVAKRD